MFCLTAIWGASVVPVRAADSDGPRKAPELAYTVPDHGDALLSQTRGKVVALEFILTTCPHCQAASRLMSQFQRDYSARGFQALDVAINALEEGRTPAQANDLVQAFANNWQTAFPVGWTPRDQMVAFMGFSVTNRFVVPQLVIIDRKGMIRYQTPPLGDPSQMQEGTIRQRIEDLLAEPVSTTSRHTSKMMPARKASS